MNEHEMIELIRSMSATSADGFTSRELAEKVGCSPSRAYVTLIRLADSGRVVPVMVQRQTRHGRLTTMPGYALAGGPNAKDPATA